MSEPSQTDHRRSLGILGMVCIGIVGIQAWFGLCLQDDAYISFRYARNAALGDGLVYNAGEPVEGYTNFLWTALFVPVEAMGLDPGPVGALLGMACTVAMLYATWRLGDRKWLAPVLVASFPGLALEGVQGLETCFYAWLVTMALVGGRASPVFAGLAALTRPEGYAVFGLLWLLRGSKIQTGAIFTGLTVPHLAFRWITYGGLVPNTFHAKVGGGEDTLLGSAVFRGLAYLGSGAWSALPLALGLLAVVVATTRDRKLPDGRRGFEMCVLVGFFFVYILAVGGDFKGTGRFLIPWLPAIACLVQAGLNRLFAARIGVVSAALAGAAVVWSVPGQLEMKDFAERFAEDLDRRRAIGTFLAETLPPDTVLAVHAAGILPYYAGLETIDMWGLNDAHIARAPVDDLGKGIAGHERHDYAYVLTRAPDFILPERGLVTDTPVQLADPPEFGPTFSKHYRAASTPTPVGHLNLWMRIPTE
ncbi:MAG TPA: hypothetical protein DFR83_16540 [Deltaproteobacteria bacterium]|nr:hypothetical protein [Deltaproteobacteria bacterium]